MQHFSPEKFQAHFSSTFKFETCFMNAKYSQGWVIQFILIRNSAAIFTYIEIVNGRKIIITDYIPHFQISHSFLRFLI
jgi:hypothetical protein